MNMYEEIQLLFLRDYLVKKTGSPDNFYDFMDWAFASADLDFEEMLASWNTLHPEKSITSDRSIKDSFKMMLHYWETAKFMENLGEEC